MDKTRGVSWTGRTDTNKRVVFPSCGLSSPVLQGLSKEEAERFAGLHIGRGRESVRDMEVEVVGKEVKEGSRREEEKVGDRIEASFTDTSSVFSTSSSSSSSSSTSSSSSSSCSSGSGEEKEVYRQGQGRAHVDVSADVEQVAGLVRDLLRERKERAKRDGGEDGHRHREGDGDGEGEEEGGAVIEKGCYVVVKILSARGHTLRYAHTEHVHVQT